MTPNHDDTATQDIALLRRKATSGARWTATSTGVRVVTQFLQVAILARLLAVGDFGLFEMIYVAVVVGQAFSDAGINNAIIHFQDATREELSSLYWLNAIVGAGVFGLTWLVVPLIAKLYGEPRLIELLRITAIVFVIAPFGQQFQLLLERDLRFRRLAFYEVLAVVLSSALAVVLAFRGAGVMSLVALTISQVAIKSVLLATHGWSTQRPRFHFRFSECRRFLRFGIFQVGERGLNLLGQHLDKLLIGLLIGMEPLGYYGQAYRLIIRPYQMVNPVFTRVAFPVFSQVQRDVERMRKGFLEMIGAVAGLMFPIYGALFAFARPIVLIQLSDKFAESIPVMRILSLVGLFYALSNPFGSILLARGRTDISFYLNVLRVVGFIGGVYLGSHFGVQGIAWALVIVVGCVMFPVGIFVRYRLIDLGVAEYFAAFMPFFVATLVVTGVAWAGLRYLPFPGPVVGLAVMLPVCALLYFGMLRVWQRQRLEKIIALVRS